MTVIKLPDRRRNKATYDAVKELNDIAAQELCDNRHFEAAIAVTKRAIHVQPNSRELWTNLAAYFWHAHETDEAMAAIDRALQLDPDFFLAIGNQALILQDLGRHDEAETAFTRAIQVNPEHYGAQWCRSILRLARGDYAGGFADYEMRIKARKDHGKFVYPKSFPSPFWKGEDLTDKSIYICSEQGIGDTIFFSRYLPLLARKARKVYLATSIDLTRLLWEFRHFLEFVPEGVAIPQTDYSAFLGSLPHLMGTVSEETIPPDPGIILELAKIQRRIAPAEIPFPPRDDALRVGICWTGNPEQERNKERTIPLELMVDLASHPNAWLYSFQAQGSAEIARVGAHHLVADLAPEITRRGLGVTADALRQMDLVVTCCTSIAHLAGALGIPTLVVLCAEPYWIWKLQGDTTPWYPSIHLIRQTKLWDWREPMKDVRNRVHRLAETRRQAVSKEGA